MQPMDNELSLTLPIGEGHEPIVVLSQADRECADCVDDTLGEHKALSELKSKVILSVKT